MSSDEKVNEKIFSAGKAGSVVRLKALAEGDTDLKAFRTRTTRAEDGCSLLHLASTSGKLEAVAYLIDEVGIPTDTQDVKGNTPVFYAALAGQLPTVKELVRRDSKCLRHCNKAGDFVALYAAGRTPQTFGEMLYHSQKDIVKTLKWLAQRNDFWFYRQNERTGKTLLHALMHAAARHDDMEEDNPLELIEWLVNTRNMSLKTPDKEGRTPLHDLLSDDYLDEPRGVEECWCDDAAAVVGSLLDLGADPDAVAKDGSSPAHALLAKPRRHIGEETLKCLRLLISRGKNMKLLVAKRVPDGASPLLAACECTGPHALFAARAILEAAPPDWLSIGKRGGTILHHVSSAELAEALYVENDYFSSCGYYGNNVFHTPLDQDGRTVLHTAAQRVAPSAVAHFASPRSCAGQIDVNARDARGNTALHLACSARRVQFCEGQGYEDEHYDTILALLRCGADPLAKTAAGETPLELLNHLSGSWWMKERTQQQRHLVMAAAERRAAGGTGFLEMPLQGKEVESPLSSSSVPPLPPAQPQPPACPLAAAFASLRLAVGPAAGGPGACRLSDATLVCCGEDIAVHSLVLASQSAFFEALLLGQFQRPDWRYPLEDVSADTLRTAVDFAYTASLPPKVDMAALAALIRAADRFAMPRLLAVCRVRVTGTLEAGDTGVFAVYEAAAETKDAETTAVVERFLLCDENCTDWLRKLVADKEAWAGLCQPESAVNALLQSILLKALAEKDEGRKRKQREGGGDAA